MLKIRCFFGFHKWFYWYDCKKLRTCCYCDKTEGRDIRDLMWL